ncbi:hypothetical protein EMPG_12693 [Blastomyces silverae]|uniref:Restriction endonuclease domain-containing protein n=1 Tax=Blastomyces silverae TaxID=2060906 RepID=A0A0H1BSV8_9EURO|nr:hypothetical protein EMPG_12693 [Blastomyces silverae]
MEIQKSLSNKGRRQAVVGQEEGIPRGACEYQFQGIEHMERVIKSHMGLLDDENNKMKGKARGATQDKFTSQFIVFSGVPSDVLEHKLAESSVIEKTFSSYHRPLKILVLKMVHLPHERASRVFERLLENILRSMGLERELGLQGRAGVYGPQRDKEPDCSYSPRTLPAGRANRWPSMVVEIADSEGQSQIEADARWWLENSDGDVKIALTISIQRTATRGIGIRRWEAIDRPTRTNPHRRVAELMQEVNIVRQGDRSIATTGAPLRLPFDRVMLRHPSTSVEADILILDEELKVLGEEVWEVQGQ